MAFLRAEAAGFRALTWAAHAHSGSPAHACLGSPDPPFRGHSSSTGEIAWSSRWQVGLLCPRTGAQGPCGSAVTSIVWVR